MHEEPTTDDIVPATPCLVSWEVYATDGSTPGPRIGVTTQLRFGVSREAYPYWYAQHMVDSGNELNPHIMHRLTPLN